MDHMSSGAMNAHMQECLQNCQACHSICLSMAATHCLEMGGKHVEPTHLRLMLDCSQICQTSADFMLRSSSFHARTCGVCAEVCDACAKSCEEVGDMQECVNACRKCVESCRMMASMG